MNIQVTLSLPESVILQATEEARVSNRSVEEILAETLEEVYPAFPVHPQRAQMEREVAAFEQIHPELWRKYPHEFVAVHDGIVVDHDKDQLALLKRVKQQFPDKIVMVDQVLPSLPQPLRVRSPRLLRDE